MDLFFIFQLSKDISYQINFLEHIAANIFGAICSRNIVALII